MKEEDWRESEKWPFFWGWTSRGWLGWVCGRGCPPVPWMGVCPSTVCAEHVWSVWTKGGTLKRHFWGPHFRANRRCNPSRCSGPGGQAVLGSVGTGLMVWSHQLGAARPQGHPQWSEKLPGNVFSASRAWGPQVRLVIMTSKRGEHLLGSCVCLRVC